MGLEEILSSIKSDTEAQYAKIVSDAKAEASKILSDAKQRSSEIALQGKADGQREAQEEHLRSVASAHLEAKRKVLEAKDELLRNYEEQAKKYLGEFARSPKYRDFLSRVVKDGISKIGPGAVVQVNSSDMQILRRENENLNISPKALDCIGGAIISSEDGKRRVDNTLESIFGEKKEELRLRLSKQVFGQ
jgi:V/A-type H+-transporting ATPase subunit E